MIKRFSILLLICLSACSALNAPDIPATMRVQNTQSVADATTIAQTYAADEAMVNATAGAVGTEVADQRSINRQLVLTARAVLPPTPQRAVGIAQPVAGGGTSEPDSLSFVDTGVTTAIRDSDGCVVSFETSISANAAMIYVDTKAISIRGGTIMGVEWQSNGAVVAQENWTVPRDETNFCIWFNLDPSKIPFTPGQWAVQLSANGQPIPPSITFTINAPGESPTDSGSPPNSGG